MKNHYWFLGILFILLLSVNVEFKQGMSTKLPIGTKLYKTDTATGPIILIQTDKELVPYLGLVEG